MRDMRIGLSENSILLSEKSKKIKIINEVNRGANSIVYNAIYKDVLGIKHKIRVKECYPSYLQISRNEKEELIEKKGEKEEFIKVKEKFIEAYRKNVIIKNTLQLTNSTINSTDIIEKNNTVYILMAIDEGIDYQQYKDETLKELFIHIKNVSEIIDKYHKNKYFHLDIKPENIFVLPDIEGHVLLFDFDSMITQRELENAERVYLTFSTGFSAPEQVQGDIKKIGTHTDIYSIGAITFYKLFNKEPQADDCRIYSKYDFSKICYASNLYSPKLYYVLETFFRKTLSASIVSRWHDMKQVIDCLDNLIELSNINGIYLKDMFCYNSGNFVGRLEELDEIKNILDENQVIFLSGIGGIGKTELAKQYANRFHKFYDSVTFARFDNDLENDLENLVCNEIIINKIDRENGEDERAYFERKVEILKKISSKNDLIIIDNFDVDSDPQLERILSCPCKFIFTTRKDFRDYNFKQIIVDKIKNQEEIMQLFCSYNDIEYNIEEKEAIRKLIKIVDYHTMTVELIAKYLRNSQALPSNLVLEFLEKGITTIENVEVKQRKDQEILSKSVNQHLLILFNIFQFDSSEKEIISSLSIFAGIRMKKSKFIEICQVEKVEQKLEKMIKDGWIEYDESTKKISLHQIIQDLIYNEFSPNAENCQKIILGMYKYITEELSSDVAVRIRWQVFDIFMKRITGSSLLYAKLCLKYGKELKIKEAEEICKKIATPVAYDMLQQICRKKIRWLCEKNEYEGNADSIVAVIDLMNQTIEYCKKASEKKEYLIEKTILIASEVESIINNTLIWKFGDTPELDAIYQKIISLYEWATEEIPKSLFSIPEKDRLYAKIQGFYLDDFEVYRAAHYSNMEKAYYYQNLLDELRKNTKPYESDYDSNVSVPKVIVDGVTTWCWGRGVSNADMAEKCRKEGRYKEAIEFYKKSYEKEDDVFFPEYNIKDIAEVYLKMGEKNNAINYLESIIKDKEDKKEYFGDLEQIYVFLLEILIKCEDYERAQYYGKVILDHYDKKEIKRENIITIYYYMYKSTEKEEQKQFYWDKCLMYYEEKLDKKSAFWKEQDFLCEYIKNTNIKCLKITEAQIENVKVLSAIIEKYKNESGFEKKYILLLLKRAEMRNYNYNEDEIQEKIIDCENAQNMYDKYNFDDEYLQNLIYQIKSDLMSKDKKYQQKSILDIQKKCNYQLLAERKCENRDVKTQVSIWEQAANAYGNIKNYKKELYCLNQSYLLTNKNNDFRESKYLILRMIREAKEGNELEYAKKLLSNLWKDMICEVIKRIGEKDRKNYIWEFREIAEEYREMNMMENVLYIHMFRLYLVCVDPINITLVEEFQLNSCSLSLISREIENNLSSVEQATIDIIISIKEELLRYKYGEEDWKIVKPIIMKIEKLYEFQEIEFKLQDI